MTTPSDLRRCVLIVAGLDPSGGAGLAADLRACTAAGAWGCPVCATLTVQSTAGLVSASPIEPAYVLEQAREVAMHDNVKAIKTGALGSVANVQAALQLVRELSPLPAVVDPVMVASRAADGTRLLDSEAREAMRELVAHATVVTPNVDEAQELLGCEIVDDHDLEEAARQLVRLGAKAALVKGGHLRGSLATDVLVVGDRAWHMNAPRHQGPEFHGGGCTLASLIAGRLALVEVIGAEAIVDAVRVAKRRLTKAIQEATSIGEGLRVLPL